MTALVQRLRHIPIPKIDGAWIAVLVLLAGIAAIDSAQLPQTIRFAAGALASTAPYIIFAILAVAYLKASGAEAIVAKAFEGRQVRMVVLAAMMGGLSPFCSCEVIPFIAGLLALGTPLAPVMAFWLSSPLMDPPAFLITAGALGWNFAVAKTIVAVGMGLLGGFVMLLMTRAGFFADSLRDRSGGGCSSCGSPFKGKPNWTFWTEEKRRETFRREAIANGYFLVKWLTLAYVLESLMIAYIPAESIAHVLGGEGLFPIVLSALIGAPAYLNSYAAPPLVAGLMEQGMSAGAAMAFVIAGGVSSIPAMTAVFALVKRPVFAAYIGLGFLGAVIAGLSFQAYISLV
ncbi:MAG: permease [Hyphomicrobiaceae bacterium]